MDKISIFKTSAGFSISFPFALKDQFRSAFPSAKWDGIGRVWTVGSRAGKRLEQWAAEAQGVVAAQAEAEERDFADAELERLRADLAAIEQRIRSETARRASAEQMQAKLREVAAMIEAVKPRLEAAEAAASAAVSAELAEKQRIDELLDGVISRRVLGDAMREMARHHNSVGAQAREAFHAAQERVREQSDRLRVAGFACRAIEALRYANFNRPERDHPNKISPAAWYEIWKVESED